MDGENIPNEEIAPAVAVGASVIDHWYPASLWSGLADGVVSCYVPDDWVFRLTFTFQTGGLETWVASILPTSAISFFCFCFV